LARTALLPARPPPLPGELLSSWLTRLSRANGDNIRHFTRALLAPAHGDNLARHRALQFWQHDADRNTDLEQLRCFARATGVDVNVLEGMTLSAYAGRLTDCVPRQGNTRWVLPLDAHAQVKRRYAVQFCPACLREDRTPYFRRVWRLAFVTVCPQHRTLLRDRCPSCGLAVVPHRTAFGTREQLLARTITHCHSCGFDLRDAPLETLGARVPKPDNPVQRRSPPMVAMASVAHFQEWLLTGLEAEHFDLRDLTMHRLPHKEQRQVFANQPHPNTISSFEFFEGLYTVARLMIKKPERYNPKRWWQRRRRRDWTWRRGIAHSVQETVRIPLQCWDTPGRHAFETLSLEDRFGVVACCSFALRDYPTRLHAVFARNAVTARRLELRKRVGCPPWILRALNAASNGLDQDEPLEFCGHPEISMMSEAEFQCRFGVTKAVFDELLQMRLEVEHSKIKSGRPPTLIPEQQVLFALEFAHRRGSLSAQARRWNVSEIVAVFTLKRMAIQLRYINETQSWLPDS
jgi:TniQ